MEEFLAFELWGNPLKEWAIALAFSVGSILVAKALYLTFGKVFKSLAERTSSKLDDILIDMLEEPIVFAVVIIGMWWGYDHLHFEEGIQVWVQRIFRVLIAINITWLLVRLVDAVMSEFLVPYAERSSGSMDQIMPVIRKTTKALIWILGVLLALNNAGYDVGALLAGVGIGGLAMAMAAKDFVANIFGGITVFIDKPFMLGDRIKIDGFDGYVRDIGIRSTKLQTLENRYITVPNHKFTDSYVENVSSEPSRKVKLTIGLTYDTPAERIKEAKAIMEEIAAKHNQTDNQYFVWFESFGDFSLNISMIYYILKEGDLFEVPNQVNLEILERFNESGLEFAFPTQTVYHSSIDQGK